MAIGIQCSTTQHWKDSRNNQKWEQYHRPQEDDARSAGVFTNGTIWTCPSIQGSHDHKCGQGNQETLSDTSNHN